MFISVAPHSASVAKEFVKYRCVVGKDEVKKAVDATGRMNLRKWLMKGL